ncbi:MAG: cache domain-containing protein, partial [Deltaproteobacteria bacterium]|nr:cache domain-containing protein [Deltaproteobacteria bacterium]
MKKFRLVTKLILVGTVTMALPLIIIGSIAVHNSSKALQALEYEQLAGTTKALGDGIDNVLKGEIKLVKDLSVGNATIAAATAVAEKGAEGASEETDSLNQELARFKDTKGLGEDYQVIIAVGADGKIIAASSKNYIGVSIADRQYFKDALSGRAHIGQVGVNKVSGKPFVPVAAPIYSADSRIVGVISNTLDIGFLDDLIDKTKIGTTGYAFVTNKAGVVIAHPNKKHILSLDMTKLAGMEAISAKMTSGQAGVSGYRFDGIDKSSGYAPVPLTGWSVALTLPDEEFLASAHAVRNIVLIVGIIFFIAAFVLYLFFARSISVPVTKIVENLNGGSNQVAAAATQISASSQSLAEGAAEQASGIEETSSSL